MRLGITAIEDASALNATHPFSMGDIGKQLGGKTWHIAQKLIERIKAEKGVDIKRTDNKYHVAIKAGKQTIIHKYSEKAVELLKHVKERQDYDVDI